MIVDYALYQNGIRYTEPSSLPELIMKAKTEGGFVWLGLAEPTQIEFDKIVGDFRFHPLAIEDIFHIPQQSKVDFFQTHLFISMILLSILPEQTSEDFGSLEPDQIMNNNNQSKTDNNLSTLLFGNRTQFIKNLKISKHLLKFHRPDIEMEQSSFFLVNDSIHF